MSASLEDLHKEVWTVKESLTMSNWDKKVELQALDILFRSGYYGSVSNTSIKE